jgi:ribosomal-protein-alanine N-acetyltransferase
MTKTFIDTLRRVTTRKQDYTLVSKDVRNPHAPELHKTLLKSYRLLLRPATVNDWISWRDLRAQSAEFLKPWEPTWAADSLEEIAFVRRVRRNYEQWQQDRGYHFLILRQDYSNTAAGNILIGAVNLSYVRRGFAQASTLGYWMGLPYVNQGFMSEAVSLMMAFGFKQLGLHRIEAACLPSNIPSKRVLNKSGFTHEGFAKKYLCINGKWQDHDLFGLCTEDYAEQIKKGEDS